MKQAIIKKELLKLTEEVSLELGRVHEILGPANDSFAITVAAKLSGPIVWIGRRRDVDTLTPMALQGYLDPTRVMLTEGMNRKELLWAGEQSLRSKAAKLVIIQLGNGPDLHESRRLQLAAEQGGSLGLILIERRAQSSASQTRWECYPKAANDGVMPERWDWQLTKNKMGNLGRWSVMWEGSRGASRDVHMVATTAA